MADVDPYAPPVGPDGDPDPEFDERFAICLRCGEPTEPCFSWGQMGLFTPPALKRRFIFFPEIVCRRSLWKRMTELQGRLFRTWFWRSCGCIIVDSAMDLSFVEARRMAKHMKVEH